MPFYILNRVFMQIMIRLAQCAFVHKFKVYQNYVGFFVDSVWRATYIWKWFLQIIPRHCWILLLQDT
jgi:hypothetical protein